MGILDEDRHPVAMAWMAPVTENPGLGDTEIWEIYNFTADAHPIHLPSLRYSPAAITDNGRDAASRVAPQWTAQEFFG